MQMYDMLSWQPVVQQRIGNENHYYHHMVPFTRVSITKRGTFATYSLPYFLYLCCSVSLQNEEVLFPVAIVLRNWLKLPSGEKEGAPPGFGTLPFAPND